VGKKRSVSQKKLPQRTARPVGQRQKKKKKNGGKTLANKEGPSSTTVFNRRGGDFKEAHIEEIEAPKSKQGLQMGGNVKGHQENISRSVPPWEAKWQKERATYRKELAKGFLRGSLQGGGKPIARTQLQKAADHRLTRGQNRQ